ncbi:MAG: Fic family protein [Lachnospiraceae bacterium]|nr:Fic family protein [Lachnospiraceae bacterium]
MSKENIEDKYIDPFAEYLISGEPDRAQKAYAWQTAIGLQDVDKIQPSQYLLNTAKDNIEGGIDFDEAKNRIDSYYEENKNHQPERTEEADKVSVRIAEILSENSFVFSPAQYISIHKRLFEGIYSHAGKMRDYNITKKEWVLDGASVIYGGALDLQATLDYDFRIEKEFDYSNLSMSEIITHLARFISKLWQIHIFGEGNTRTSAVFFIKYIRSLGFHATNDVFANNSWYFRNALVRANYTNLSLGVREDLSFLELFLRNLLMGEKNELKNRYMHIAWKETTHSNNKRHIERHIEQHIDPKGAIKQLEIILDTNVVSERTKSNILNLFNEFGYEKIFSRGDVIKSLGITEKPASTLVKRMYELGITEKMIGVGKGKYRFIWN